MTEDVKATLKPAGIDRRTVVKGAAWSLPVVALATATPAAAASPVGPLPAPSDGSSQFQAGVAIQKFTTSSPDRVNINNGTSNVSFYVLDGEGDPYADGLYESGQLYFTLNWGASLSVPTPGSYDFSEVALNGWSLFGPAPSPGTSGTVTYYRSGILNGAANQVLLPQLRLQPSSGEALPASEVATSLFSEYLSPIGSSIVTP